MNVLQDVGSETAQLDELGRLRAENAALRAKAAKQATARLRLKVSEKGALSLYGMGRFPVTLYRGQWEKLLDMAPEIREYIQDHSAALSVKE